MPDEPDEELPDECCAKCRFWGPPTENQLREDPEAEGECLRYPPSLQRDSDGMLVSWFPDIAGYEWCGEFQPDVEEPIQITATASTPLWSPPQAPLTVNPAPVYGPGFGPKEDNNKAWPEDWGK